MGDMFRPVSQRPLRPYQEEAIRLIRASLGQGNRRVVCQAPTGAGKTRIAAEMIALARSKGNRVIFTAPAISLIDQTVTAFEAEGIWDIGVMQANHPRTNPALPVQVCSVQTLARREIPQAAMMIIDEAHILSEVVNRLMVERPDVFFIGLSATPWAKGMGLIWQDLVIPVTIGNLINDGYLSKFTAFAPDVPDLSGVKTVAGEYAEAALSKVMGGAAIMGSVVNNWLEHGEDRPTLLFGVNRAHAAELQAQFLARGIAAGYCDANTDIVERARLKRRFTTGEVRIACSVRTLTTGVDWEVSCIIDAAPTKSEMLHVQKLGRGMRVNPGTEDLKIFDHAGNCLRLGLPTEIYHPELDRTSKGERQVREVLEKLPKPCPVCGALQVGAVCTACGHEKKPRSQVEAVDGALVAIGKKKVTMPDRQLFWSMALHLDRHRNKGGRLAKGLYKSRFDVWPRGLDNAPVQPDQAFMNWEHHSRIAYAKRMRRGEAHRVS
jgi:DNA repair protein RadD